MKESDLYKPVEAFVKTEFNCFHTAINRGTKAGKIDVIGIRNTLSDFGGHTDIIAVEVKPKGATFLKSLGQAYAYSVMTDRCYLAIHKPRDTEFSQEEKDLAERLGVGLIKIGAYKECKIETSSALHTPLIAHKLALLYKIGYSQCSICQSVFKSDGNIAKQKGSVTIQKAITNTTSFQYWLSGLYDQKNDNRDYVYDKRFFCEDCVQAFKGLAHQ